MWQMRSVGTKFVVFFFATTALSACSALSDLPAPLKRVGDFATHDSVSEARSRMVASLSPKVSGTALVQEGVLTVGLKTATSTAPFCMSMGSSQEYDGIDIDLAYALGDALGLPVRFVDASNPIAALGKTCDVVMGMSNNEASGVVIEGEYAQTAIAFFHRGDTGIAKVSDLSSKRVGIQAGSTSQKALHSTGLLMEEKSFDNLNDAFSALAAGEVDYVLCDAYTGAYLAKSFDDISMSGTLNSATAKGVGLLGSSVVLRDAISSASHEIQSNGVESLTLSAWVGSMEPLNDTMQIADIPPANDDSQSTTTTTGITTTLGNTTTSVVGAGSNAVTL